MGVDDNVKALMKPFSHAMRIAGNKTVDHWSVMKSRLRAAPKDEGLWDEIFDDFYLTRIKTRYLEPMESIRARGTRNGEGFAIVALFCSLIEFLESCETGQKYHHLKKGEKLSENEYSNSSDCFQTFLKTRSPFKTLVPSKLVKGFYEDVRCGLLHEARTKGGWVVAASGSNLISETAGEITISRNRLVPALNEYFEDYRSRLLANRSTQEAFIRKFDHLCES
jgi:hypothetical protein